MTHLPSNSHLNFPGLAQQQQNPHKTRKQKIKNKKMTVIKQADPNSPLPHPLSKEAVLPGCPLPWKKMQLDCRTYATPLNETNFRRRGKSGQWGAGSSAKLDGGLFFSWASDGLDVPWSEGVGNPRGRSTESHLFGSHG